MGCGATKQPNAKEPEKLAQSKQNQSQPLTKNEPASNSIQARQQVESKSPESAASLNSIQLPDPELAALIKSTKINATPNKEAAELINQAWILHSKDDKSGAKALFIKSTEIDSNCFETWRLAAYYCRVFCQDNIYMNLLKKVIELNPGHLASYIELALAYNDAKNYKEGTNYFRKAGEVHEITKERVEGFVINNVAAGYMFCEGEKEYKSAVAWLERFYLRTTDEFDKDSLNTMRHWLACAAYEAKEWPKFLKVALRIVNEPGFCEPHIYSSAKLLANYYGEQKDEVNQKKYQEITLKYMIEENIKKPNDANLAIEIGTRYYDIKNYADGIVYFKKAVSIKQNENAKLPYWIVGNVASGYVIYLKDFKNGIEWIKQFYKHKDFEDHERDTLADWLANSYYSLKDMKSYIPIANEIIASSKNEGSRKLHAGWLINYYCDEYDFINAQQYLKLIPSDSVFCKFFNSKRVTLKFTFKTFKQLMTKCYSHFANKKITFALPSEQESQKLLSFESDYNKFRLIKEPPYNEVEFDFSDGFPEKINMTVKLEIRAIFGNMKTIENINDPKHPYYKEATFSDSFYDWNDPDFMKRCAEVASNGKTVYEKLLLLRNYVAKNYLHNINNPECTTEISPGVFKTDPAKIPKYSKASEILLKMKGDCVIDSILYVCMARTLGVPARTVGGFTLSNIPKGYCGDHCVTELYNDAEKRWVFVEPQGGYGFGIYNNNLVLMSMDRNEDKSKNYASLIYLREKDEEMTDKNDALYFEYDIIFYT